jgi:hypothetical protein
VLLLTGAVAAPPAGAALAVVEVTPLLGLVGGPEADAEVGVAVVEAGVVAGWPSDRAAAAASAFVSGIEEEAGAAAAAAAAGAEMEEGAVGAGGCLLGLVGAGACAEGAAVDVAAVCPVARAAAAARALVRLPPTMLLVGRGGEAGGGALVVPLGARANPASWLLAALVVELIEVALAGGCCTCDDDVDGGP